MLGQEVLLIISNINCLFGVTNIANNSDKEQCVYSGYGIKFVQAHWVLVMTLLGTF